MEQWRLFLAYHSDGGVDEKLIDEGFFGLSDVLADFLARVFWYACRFDVAHLFASDHANII